MSIDAKTLLRITQIEMPPEALREVLRVLADVQFAEDERKARDRDRKRAGNFHGKSSENPGKILGKSDGNGAEFPAENPTPSAPQRDIIKPPAIPSPSSLRSESRDAFRAAFEHFWDMFPNKVGKPVAERHFAKLWREMNGDVSSITNGLQAYVRDKPADRPWLNPSTFLNQRRFDDRPASPPARAGPAGRPLDGTTAVLRKLSEARHDQQHFDDQQNGPEAGASDARASSSPRSADERGRRQWDGPQLDLVAVGADRR